MSSDSGVEAVGRIQPGACQRQVGAQPPREAGHPVHPPNVGEEPDRCLRHGEEGVLRRHAVLAVDGDAHPAPHDNPVPNADLRHVVRVLRSDAVVQPILLPEEVSREEAPPSLPVIAFLLPPGRLVGCQFGS